jgi:GTP-binding protein Era
MSSRSEPEAARPHRAGTVAIVGRPNVGKSTLLNRLVGCKLSITSSRPQTTRQRITGIVTRPGAQILLVDTPGYQKEHDNALNRAMNRSVAASLAEVDAIVWVIEALKFDERDERIGQLLPSGAAVVLVINKTDAVKEKPRLLPFIAGLSGRRRFEAIIPLSAATGSQVETLLDAIVPLLPEGPALHEADEFTTASERFLAAELLREKLFEQLGDELPYAAAVEISRFQQEGGLRRIEATILVDKEGQKPIVIGRQGAKLKSIATRARREMERLFGGKVFLQVWVKVRRGWADSDAGLRRMGYGE